MRKIIGIIALAFIVGSVLLALAALRGAPERALVEGSEFSRLISLSVTEKVGKPIEGFSPRLYLNALPGLVEADFDSVEAIGGRFTYDSGELVFVRGFGKPISAADETITTAGHETLLKNVRERLGGRVSLKDIVGAISEKVTSFEECVAAGYPVSESYPRRCLIPEDRSFIEDMPSGSVACTQEARLCPDGSSVGRTGPNCEFAACPAPSGSSKSGIRGTAVSGPNCPVQIQIYPPDPKCADKPFSGSLAVTAPGSNVIIRAFNPASDGTFSVELPEGEYAIRYASGENVLPRCSATALIKVVPGSFSEVRVYCDSGMR